ncbi:MAG TPA: hypothetical protein ENF23_05965 [Methanosarcinales archaeon]|nr:MAG: hypothetical protein DRO03_09110 [Methanosarcinales archaeon]HDN65819.1 hypothetical protein [Methanosarcinales archaeon]
MSYEDAIKDTGNGVMIDLKVIPGSGSTEVPSGYDESRNRIRAKVSAKAIEGKANKQLIREFSRLFGISSAQIRLKGQASTRKSIELIGVARADVIRTLSLFFEHDREN